MERPYHLIDKYNAPVPRYTSYPPANHFTDKFTADEYSNAIVESNEQNPKNISVYIHIPYCQKLCYYCGCNACPMPKYDEVAHYVSALKKELNIVLDKLDKSRKLSQIHYGGGTPNSIPLNYLSEINKLIFSKFDKIVDPEIAIECNPAYIDYADIDELLEAGFNRFSFGVQDFDLQVLNDVNREPSKLPIDELMNYLRLKSPTSMINLDFIYGLTGQSAESFLKTIHKAIELKPDRLVTFSYAHVPWVNKTQKILEKKGLPEQNEKLEMYYQSHELLEKSGYMPVGFDHYVLEHDELYKAFKNNELHRNFQGYCTRRTTGQVYAFGVSAISQLERVYAQNTKEIRKYLESLENGKLPIEKGYALLQNEIIVREVLTKLLGNKFIDLEQVATELKISLESLKDVLQINYDSLLEFEKDGILMLHDNKIEITDLGVLFIRNVAAAFDPLYEIKENKYSRSV